MGDVVQISEHREKPGTLWFAGILKCIYCAEEHVTVMPMPSWAQVPVTAECPGCHEMGAIPVHDGFRDDPTRDTPWATAAGEREPPADVLAAAEALLDDDE